jgi:hypothetical protein
LASPRSIQELTFAGLLLGLVWQWREGPYCCIATYRDPPQRGLLIGEILFCATPFARTVEEAIGREGIYEPVVDADIPGFV